MKYVDNLLKKYISVSDSPDNIAKNLILKTCEIEEIIKREIPKDVVIGYVKECYQHPEANKLSVCTVDCGDKGEHTICCGGENVKEGIYVATALIGCYLPVINIKIGARKLRGIDSNGMICSKEELGIQEDLDTHNIWILEEDLSGITKDDLGIPLTDKYPLLDSVVYDVDNKSLTNRPDLTGHFGVSVELNAIYDKGSIKFNKISQYIDDFRHTNIEEVLLNADKSDRKVISKTDDVRTYILLKLTDIKVQRSFLLTRLYLLDLGLQPKNNWVDFSNLFLYLTGQPVHFFDADKVNGDIIVRNAEDGEEFIDLFGKKHLLTKEDIVITDKDKILALAGVIGSETSGVDENTKNILVEIANFDNVSVRKTGVRLGLRTDAELRYEKNINPIYSLYSLLLMLDFLKEHGIELLGAELGGLDYYIREDIKQQLANKKEIGIDLSLMSRFVFGKDVSDFIDKTPKILEGLGFELNEDMNKVVVPVWRGPDDINIWNDVCEEVVRVYGYEKVEPTPIYDEMSNVEFLPLVDTLRTIESTLVDVCKFDYLETYPRVSKDVLKIFKTDISKLLELQNPINSDAPYLRDDMTYNLLNYVAKNTKFFDELKVFDIGEVWKNEQPDVISEFMKNTDKNYSAKIINENMTVSAIIYKKDIVTWKEDTFLTAKSVIKQLLDKLGLKEARLHLVDSNYDLYHPNKQAYIEIEVGDKKEKIGFVATLHPLLLKSFKISDKSGLSILSLNLDKLAYLKDEEEYTADFETLKDQIVWRDLCFVLDSDKKFDIVMNTIKSYDGVEDIEVFDLYKGDNLGDNKKSISFKFKILGDGNMTTEDINKIMSDLIKKVESKGAKLRQ